MSLRAVVFFSSRSLHTRCALVTGVQTCALPISIMRGVMQAAAEGRISPSEANAIGTTVESYRKIVESTELEQRLVKLVQHTGRSGESRVGKEGVSKCRSRGLTYHYIINICISHK